MGLTGPCNESSDKSLGEGDTCSLCTHEKTGPPKQGCLPEVPQPISSAHEDSGPGPSTHGGRGGCPSIPSTLFRDPASISFGDRVNLASPMTLLSLEIKGHIRASGFPSLSRKEALGVRKLLVLTHRTRDSSPGNSPTLFPWCQAVWHPFPSEAHSQGWVSLVGVGHRQICPAESSCLPNTTSPTDVQAHGKHSYPLVTANPEWGCHGIQLLPASRDLGGFHQQSQGPPCATG